MKLSRDIRNEFKAVGSPYPDGRLVGKPTVKQEPKQAPASNINIEGLVKEVLKVCTTVDVDSGFDKLPLQKAAAMSYLNAVETFLQSQLLQVQRAKQNLKRIENEDEN